MAAEIELMAGTETMAEKKQWGVDRVVVKGNLGRDMTRKANVKGGWQGSRVSESVKEACVREYEGGESAWVVGERYGVHAKSVYLWVVGRGGRVRGRKEACWLRHGKKLGVEL